MNCLMIHTENFLHILSNVKLNKKSLFGSMKNNLHLIKVTKKNEKCYHSVLIAKYKLLTAFFAKNNW